MLVLEVELFDSPFPEGTGIRCRAPIAPPPPQRPQSMLCNTNLSQWKQCVSLTCQSAVGAVWVFNKPVYSGSGCCTIMPSHSIVMQTGWYLMSSGQMTVELVFLVPVGSFVYILWTSVIVFLLWLALSIEPCICYKLELVKMVIFWGYYITPLVLRWYWLLLPKH